MKETILYMQPKNHIAITRRHEMINTSLTCNITSTQKIQTWIKVLVYRSFVIFVQTAYLTGMTWKVKDLIDTLTRYSQTYSVVTLVG